VCQVEDGLRKKKLTNYLRVITVFYERMVDWNKRLIIHGSCLGLVNIIDILNGLHLWIQ